MTDARVVTAIDQDRFLGCFVGLAVGDAFGAHYEGGPLERLLWKAIGSTKDKRMRYTDDTQMSINLAESFLHSGRIDQDHLAKTFAASYRWSRGYGPSAGKLLKRIRGGRHWRECNRAQHPEGSFGNGAAMRAPILALCFTHQQEEFENSVGLSAEITHAHPLTVEGARLVARATRLALAGGQATELMAALCDAQWSESFKSKLECAAQWLAEGSNPGRSEIKQQLGNGMSASESCVTAIYFSLRHLEDEFANMLKGIFKLGGDADTIAAMAGAIWGAHNGMQAIDSAQAQQIEDFEHIQKLATRLWQEQAASA